ncbi:hypothetical protein ASF41_13210 [Methylobacterium sp. Leaf111]|uniref:phosphoribosyltransferase n=1 Tax=Methylobacterium sp. Leaf111 TaxID=1736257 RepID=UPI0006F2B38C|nr:phosphoribosyltransferase [Methylobacterium sp. Leaf111]KQP51139.1 hypothetical protein ASF41_13210 [Methylobacterium sp. Leaf111]
MPELASHPGYWAAKKRGDAQAAIRICEDMFRDPVLDEIQDAAHDAADREKPIVVAPSLTPDESSNALSRGYGRWLAEEMGWPFDRSIHQRRTMSRDFNKDMWYRIGHEPEFDGIVQAGRRYVIADDVCTGGGTVAALRGFIEGQGAEVCCITALAAGDGGHPLISLAPETLSGLNEACAGALANVFLAEVGHGIECVTEQEGRFLLRCASVDAFRARIHGARHPGSGQPSGSGVAGP